jgi:Zn-dependent protease with chaperone function
MLLVGVGAYWFGLPLAARGLADRMPASALEGLSDQTLQILDGQVFVPSELPVARQQALTARFATIRWPTTASIPMRVLYRKSDQLGANALALPSGTIVVTDGLVALAKSDDEILAVLAHEAGHVQERHGLRGIIQSSAVSLIATWLVGDVGSLIAIAPTALLQAKYSRDLERDADGYAATTLRGNGLSLGLLADMLERMEAAHGGSAGRLAGAISYISTHPATEDRIASLRR